MEPEPESSAEQQVKHGELDVDAGEVAEIVRRLKSESNEVENLGEGSRREGETVTDHYERELTERAEEALREWNKGSSEGVDEGG